MLVEQLKVVGTGGAACTEPEYALDTCWVKALLDVEKQTAIEVGQWSEKHELDIMSDGRPVVLWARLSPTPASAPPPP